VSFEVVCGINWGDEGKGRVVDFLAHDADLVVRFQGGNNAGHTVINELGTFKLHLIPSGIFRPEVVNVLGPGMVIDLEGFADELKSLESQGVRGQVVVSDRATVCFPFHRNEDSWEEERLGGLAYGSTKRGIAPAYGDRHLKKGIQVGELAHPDHLLERLRGIVEWKNLTAHGVYGRSEGVNLDEVMEWVRRFSPPVLEHMVDTSRLLDDAWKSGKRILCEAQLGALRDVYFGIYPYTSSSCPLAGFAGVGAGLARTPTRVIGVVKAFSTCVGAGPFVTELPSDFADSFREMANEYGAATGRPRRIGHFDALASAYGVRVQGATELALTKLDCLSGIDPLKICVGYEVDGTRLDSFPIVPLLDRAVPVYSDMPGWQEPITDVRRFDALPAAARDYVLEIERLLECPIRYVSVGAERDAMIVRSA